MLLGRLRYRYRLVTTHPRRYANLFRTIYERRCRSIVEITHPDDRARDREFAALLFAGTLPRYKAQKRYIRKDGEVVKARIVVTPLVEASREIRYLFSMAMEVNG